MRYKNQNKSNSIHKKGTLLIRNYGALKEYLNHNPRSIKKIFAKEKLYAEIHSYLKNNSIPFDSNSIQSIPESDGDRDSLEAEISIPYLSENDFLADEKFQSSIVVMLDHINDPRNFGAIARSCAFFGVRSIIIANKRQVGVTQVVLDTAQGAFSRLNVVMVANLNRMLDLLKQSGYWVLGTSLDGKNVATEKIEFEKSVVVMGSEENGLSSLIKKNCDVCYLIPSTNGGIESLNVSVALGIFLFALNRPAPI